ncbi:MAG: lipase family alpha/beta hydrolase [Actinomycetota bacterium]
MALPRRMIMAGAAALLVAGAVVAAVLAARPARRPAAAVPVLLVPGYLGTPAQMSDIASRLRASGRRVVSVALPGRGVGDMVVSGRALGRAVEATGAAQVDLVGFSAGGIVVRTYLSEPGGSERARRVVLLGAPNHGAEAAELAASFDGSLCVGACAQLTPGSSLLARLNRDETPDGATYVTIWTQRDTTVTPPRSAILDGAVNVRVQSVCAGAPTTHGDLIRDPLPVGLAVLAVNGELEAASGPSGCERVRRRGAAPAASALSPSAYGSGVENMWSSRSSESLR